MLAPRWFVVLALAGSASGAFAAADYEHYDEYLSSLYRDTVPTVEAEDVPARMEEDPSTILLDVRSDSERGVSFIGGSEFHDYDDFSVDPFLRLSRDTPIILYCAVGYRSERIGEKLMAEGFLDVSHLYGGIIEWHNRGLPLESEGSSGPAVHGYEPKWGRWVQDGNVTHDPPVE